MTDEFRQAAIMHYIQNFKESPDTYALAKKRIFEIHELTRALDADPGPIRPVDNKPESERTKEIRIKLEKLNEKSTDDEG